MDTLLVQHLQRLYGMDPFIPHMVFQFPRLPPTSPQPHIHDPIHSQFLKQVDAVQRLDRFAYASRQQAESLLSGSKIIPPDHPLYIEQDSIRTLRAENDKLLKENLELKKRLDENTA